MLCRFARWSVLLGSHLFLLDLLAYQEPATTRSADFSRRVGISRISNPQALQRTHELPTGSRRYSRLETCATTLWFTVCFLSLGTG
jgi:hypothetical protein